MKKRDIIAMAFEEIGMADYVFDVTPDQLQSCLRRLDSMMATWNGRGIRIGYPLPGFPSDSDLDQSVGAPDWAIEAIALNLGVSISPSYGKAVPVETKAAAKAAYGVLLSRAALPPEMQWPANMPVGAGFKAVDQGPFFDSPQDRLTAGPDTLLNI